MSDEEYQPANEPALLLTTLAEGEWGKYAMLMNSTDWFEDDSPVWDQLAAAHLRDIDIFERLLDWPADRLQDAIQFLVPAVGKLRYMSLQDGVRYLKFAVRVPISYRFKLTAQLRPHFIRDRGLALSLREFATDPVNLHEGILRIWAGTLCSTRPMDATDLVVDLLDGNGTRHAAGVAAILQFLPFDNADIVSKLEPFENVLTESSLSLVEVPETHAWMSLMAMLPFSKSAAVAVESAVHEGNEDASVALASWLYESPRVL